LSRFLESLKSDFRQCFGFWNRTSKTIG
jgi:hypothetical protein